MSRLDRLGPVAREIAQVGAAIGREFSYELIAAVAEHNDSALRAALDQLVDAGLVFRRGSLPEVTFLFKHALVQDAAHGTLLKSHRQHLHGRIAQVLEERLPDRASAHPELVASHYAQAGLVEKAIKYWDQAGRLAVQRSTMAEAAVHFGKALQLLASLPKSPQRRSTELSLQLALAGALHAAKGWASPQAGGFGWAGIESSKFAVLLSPGSRKAPLCNPCLRNELSPLSGRAPSANVRRRLEAEATPRITPRARPRKKILVY
jgi:predicted ATPase